jgi:hypothetical protein
MAEKTGITISMARHIELWPIERLKPYERNARTHSDKQVAQIAASIAEFGFTNPILVDSNDGIVAGHGRLAAARELGLKQIPVVVLDHFSERQRRAYVLADNQLALNAGWDYELLSTELSALSDLEFDVGLVGFDEQQMRQLLGDFDETLLGSQDANDEWTGMPEYEHEDQTSYRRLIVHFKTEEDVQAFARLIDQNLTDKTRSIWFPPDEIGRIADKRYG